MYSRPSMDRKNRKHQGGSILIMAAIIVSTAIILLASIDIGFLFYQKRELQKVADLAALAGAQQLVKAVANGETSCQSSFAIAQANAAANAFPDTVTISCGRWDPQQTATAPHYAISANGPLQTQSANAVEIRLHRSFDRFFGTWTKQRVDAHAIAMGSPLSPIAVFSVGSRLFQIRENGTVPTLVKAIGLDLGGTSLTSYQGLAGVPVQTAGLLKALGFDIDAQADIATIKSVLNTSTSSCTTAGSCPLSTLISTIGTVGGQQQLLSLLQLDGTELGMEIKLLTDATGRGLFTLLDIANGQAALLTNVDALQLLTAALGVANSHRFKDLTTVINLPALANVTTKVGVVEPPSIGIGGVGTTAFSSQVRLFSRIQADKLTASLLHVDLPIVVDLVNGQGTIIDMCNVKDLNGNDTATIAVQAPILETCVGNFNESNAFSTASACTSGLQDKEIVNLLNGALRLSTHFKIDALPSNFSPVTLSKGQSVTLGSNNLQIGTTLKAVLGTVLGKLLGQGQGVISNSSLASALLGVPGSTLQSATETLDTSLRSLRIFVNSLDTATRQLLGGTLSAAVISLLNGVGNLLTGLLTSIGNLLGNLLGNVACALSGQYSQCMLEKELAGSQTNSGNTVSNVLLSLLGLVTDLLRPLLDNLGTQLANSLNDLLGLQIGEVDVKLIDLNCAARTDVRLVY